MHRVCGWAAAFLVAVMGVSTAQEYISDNPGLIEASQQGWLVWGSHQGWGDLGINVPAHRIGETPPPLRIGSEEYAKGLGTHAPSEVILRLDGRYARFESEVGLQAGSGGSVIFQVYVDGTKAFESDVVRAETPPQPVSVPVSGARELRLVVTDAGDGISQDAANWVNARLVPAEQPVSVEKHRADAVDVAPFGQVVSFDPGRMDGARATRITEFPAEDVFLDSVVVPGADGSFEIPRAEDGRGCIGLQWPERRRLERLELAFVDEANVPAPEGVEVQGWVGETRWQGAWEPLGGELSVEDGRWILSVAALQGTPFAAGITKVRWILPESCRPGPVRRPAAFTASRWAEAELRLELEKPQPGRTAQVEVYNGENLGAEAGASPYRLTWDLSGPLDLEVRYCFTEAWKSDRTVLRVSLPDQAFGVAVDDVLANDAIYVRDAGLFATRRPAPVTLAEYKERVEGRTTVLEEVRNRPDQTFESAMEHIYNPLQDNGPVMLSLAHHNEKFVVRAGERPHMNFMIPEWDKAEEGAIRRPSQPDHNAPVMVYTLPHTFMPFKFLPRFGSGRHENASRTLYGGWLPVPTTTIEEDGVVYVQRTFVAPFPAAAGESVPRALCVSELTVENTGSNEAEASLELNFFANAEEGQPAKLKAGENRVAALGEEFLLASLDTSERGALEAAAREGVVTLSGRLAPGERARCFVFIPGWDAQPEEEAQFEDGDRLLKETKAYWKEVLSGALQLDIPDDGFENIIRASQVHCLIAAYTAADGQSIEPWISSMLYGPLESEANSIIRGMNFMGHADFARRGLEYFVSKYSPEGFLTTGYTLAGTGSHLWSLSEYYQLSGNDEWMKKNASEVARVCRWVVDQTHKTRRAGAKEEELPEWGLMPPGVLADWGPLAYYYCLNGYYYAGLSRAARALQAVGHPDGEALEAAAAELKDDIQRAFDWTQARSPVLPLRDGTWIPAYGSQVYVMGPTIEYYPEAGHAWAYDVELGGHHLIAQGVLAPNGDDARWTMEHMEDVQFLFPGMCAFDPRTDPFNLGGFSKVQPYYARNVEIYALADEVKPFIRSYFNTLPSLLNRENLSLWEHPRASLGWNKTHETGYFLQQTRFMLVMERDRELWLAPFVTQHWMQDGMEVRVDQAPTRFGPVGYRIVSHAGEGYIEAEIDPPLREAPEALVIRLRHPEGQPIRSVTVNGRAHDGFDPERECIRLDPAEETIRIRAEYGP